MVQKLYIPRGNTLKQNQTLAFAALLTITTGLSFAQGNHGCEEFTSSGTFVVPKGVKAINVEIWGAGGAGGPGFPDSDQTKEGPGGGGGAGGYLRGTLTVKQKQTYLVNIGAGGTTATIGSLSGGSGTPTTLVELVSNTVVASASGGAGGGGGAFGAPGAAGAGGDMIEANRFLTRDGANGSAGTNTGFPSSAGLGASPTNGTIGINVLNTSPIPSGGGHGGSIYPGQETGTAGGRGHVIINW